MSFPTWCFHYWSDLHQTSYEYSFNNDLLHTIVIFSIIQFRNAFSRVFLYLGLRKIWGLPLRVFRPDAFIIDPIFIKISMEVHWTMAFYIYSTVLKIQIIFFFMFFRILDLEKLNIAAKGFITCWFYYWPKKRLNIPYQKPFG